MLSRIAFCYNNKYNNISTKSINKNIWCYISIETKSIHPKSSQFCIYKLRPPINHLEISQSNSSRIHFELGAKNRRYYNRPTSHLSTPAVLFPKPPTTTTTTENGGLAESDSAALHIRLLPRIPSLRAVSY